jgi:AsmA protein
MTRKFRIATIGAGTVVLVGLVLPRLINVNNFRPKLETELSTALGRQVKIGELTLSILSGAVSADNISIADDPAFSNSPFITAKSFSAGVNLRPLILSRTLRVTGIKLEEPQITLLRGPNGTWNASTIGKTTATEKQTNEAARSGQESSLSVDKLTVTNGRVVVGHEKLGNKPFVYEKVTIEVTDFSSTAPFAFTMTAKLPGEGNVSLNGTSAPIKLGEIETTAFEATIEARKIDLVASGLVAPSTEIEGVVDVNAVVRAAKQQVKANGTIKAEKLKLAAKGTPMKRSVEVKYDLDYNLKTSVGTVTQGEVGIGKAFSRMTGGYQTPQEQTATLDIKLTGNGMPIDDLEAVLPAVGMALPSGSKLQGGAVSIDLVIAGQLDKLVISGPIRLANAKLAGFDLGSKMSAIPALSGRQTDGKDTSIQNLSATVRMSPEGVQANAINVDIPSLGFVTGAGTVSSSGALNFDMNATLTAGPAVIEKTRSGGQGEGGGVAFSIQGTASDPKFVPDVKSIASSAITRRVASAIPETALAEKVRGRRR